MLTTAFLKTNFKISPVLIHVFTETIINPINI
uniref:Uncharacterized protein n=1 Tax=Tetranychus urticae TaxID=32264 RepID=T1KGB3_TETUR